MQCLSPEDENLIREVREIARELNKTPRRDPSTGKLKHVEGYLTICADSAGEVKVLWKEEVVLRSLVEGEKERPFVNVTEECKKQVHELYLKVKK
jgi:hypothetical protein